MKGTIVLDEQVFVVTDVRLRHGAFEFEVTLRGPMAAGEYDRPRLHGEDGSLVYQSASRITWPEVGPNDIAELRWRLEPQPSLGTRVSIIDEREHR